MAEKGQDDLWRRVIHVCRTAAEKIRTYSVNDKFDAAEDGTDHISL
jgi:hypothetical protein